MADIRDTPTAAIPGIVATARATFRSGVTKPLAWRHGQVGARIAFPPRTGCALDTNQQRPVNTPQLAALKRLIDENFAALADALYKDLGGNSFWIDGVEIETVRSELKETRAHLDKWAARDGVSTPLLVQPASSYIEAQPYGVVLIIAPW